MEVIILPDAESVGKEAARQIAALIRRKPNAVLGLATGSTPIPCYRELIRMHREEGLDFSHVMTFNLDEYYPIDPRHPQSYRYFMDEHLLKRRGRSIPAPLVASFKTVSKRPRVVRLWATTPFGFKLFGRKGVVVAVHLNEMLPLVGHIVLKENRIDRANGFASATVNALVRVDVKHHFALVFVLPRMDAINRASLYAGSVFSADARLADDASHCDRPPFAIFNRLQFTTG